MSKQQVNRLFQALSFDGKRMRHVLRLTAVCLLGILLLSLTVFGAEPDRTALYTNEETGYIAFLSDSQDLLSAEEEAKLLEEMKPITAYGNVGFDSAYPSGRTWRSYLETYYIDYFNQDSTLFLIDMYNREIVLYSSGAIENTISKSKADSITDNVYSYASDGDYYRCASKAFSQELTVLSGGRIAEPMKWISAVLLSLILALLINYLIIRFTTSNEVATEDVILAAAAAAAAITAAPIVVTKREKIKSDSGGGGGGGSFGGGGGGGLGGSGGSHRF